MDDPAGEPDAGLALTDEDFDAFRREKWRSAAFNNERLKVRRKLTEMARPMAHRLAEAGQPLEMQVSLSHPYTFNKFSVDSLWVYWSRLEVNRRKLRRLLGRELGKDLDPNYTHCILVFGLDVEKVDVGLKIHSAAWWDGQNLKNKCRDETALREWTAILNALDGFVLSIHDWRKEYRCGALLAGDLANYFDYYVPGEHWLNLCRSIPRTDPLARDASLVDRVAGDLVRLIPAYRFIAWTPENDYLALRAGSP